MNLASPDRFLWLLAAIPVVLFYLLRTRPRRQPVSTLLFWQQVFDQRRQRSWWQRLRHLLSLLLQLAFLGLLTAALIDPLWPDQENRSRRVAIVLDNSASMQADSGEGQTRFQKAVSEAQRVVSRLRDGDEVTLITAGGEVRALVGVTDFPPAVRDALQSLGPTDAPSRTDEAVGLARRLVADHERREIVVISDGCFESAEQLAVAEEVRLINVGRPADNIAITALEARRSLVDPIGYAVFVEVQNLGDSATECRLSIELEDELVDVVPLNLDADAEWRKSYSYASRQGGVLTVSIDAEDGFAVDNVARAILPARNAIPVTLVTDRASVYLQKVLEAIPLVDLTITDSPDQLAAPGGITVLHRVVPESLPVGPLLVIDPQAGSDRWQVGSQIDSAIIVDQAKDSPLLAHVQLVNVTLPTSHDLQVAENAERLLTAADGSTPMAAVAHSDGRTVVLATDVDDGDLPLRIAFPVMMTNAMNWLLNRTGDLQPTIRTGMVSEIAYGGEESRVLDLAAGQTADPIQASAADVPSLAWRDASGMLRPASLSNGRASVGPVDHVGVIQLGPRQFLQHENSASATGTDAAEARNDQRLQPIAVNLADAVESDLRPKIGAERSDRGEIAKAGNQSIWFYLCIFALGFVLSEWALYQRRVVA